MTSPPLSSQPTGPYAPAQEATGAVIVGRYKLLEQIGEGGMGTVWVAEQTQPVRRKVALKLVKAGMDSKAVLARFEQERQALALMDHPNIAKVLDGGTIQISDFRLQNADFKSDISNPQCEIGIGRPFFVMEYVKGIPLTRYCDDARLTVQQRLALFVPICQAVQHAHQKGIIHRDLKPSNILVCLYDGVPVPKVIDFGLAKAMHQPLTEHTLYTAHGVMVGTPLYMSPEQAEVNNLDVDTRTDVYSLGVILYELLTGTTPLERKRFKESAWQEMLRLIKEEEPPKPSTRLSGSATLPAVAAQRQLEPAKLSRLIRGELDWIVMKALEKERSRRYETVNGLARDVQRYLADEVVEARPPSTGYRLRKFARKHRALLTTATVIAVLLVGGIVGTTLGLIRARAAEQDAVRAQEAEAEQRQLADANAEKALTSAAAEKAAKEAAEARRTEIETVLEFVEEEIFAYARPERREDDDTEVTVRAAIEYALPAVDHYFKEKPLIEARLRLTLGKLFHTLGEAEPARQQLQRSLDLRKAHLGAEASPTLESLQHLVVSYTALGRHADAIKLCEELLELHKAKLGPDHADTLASMHRLAWAYHAASRPTEAVPLAKETLRLRKDKLGLSHADTLQTMHNLGIMYHHEKRLQEARQVNEETLKLRRDSLGPDHPSTLHSMNNLAAVYAALGKYADALKLCEQTVDLRKAKLGPEDPRTLDSMGMLARLYEKNGQFAEALALDRKALAGRKATHGLDHPETLKSMGAVARGHLRLREYPEAVRLFEEVVARRKTVLGPDAPLTLLGMRNLARSYHGLGEHAKAIAIVEDALPRCVAKLGPDHSTTNLVITDWAGIYATLGRHADAIRLNDEALAVAQAKLGPTHSRTLYWKNNLAWQLATSPDAKLHDPKRAVELATQAVDGAPKNHSHRNTLGVARYRAGDWKGAIADLKQANNLRQPDDPRSASDGFFLAMAHWRLGDKDQARTWFDKSVAWMDKGRKEHADLQRFHAEAAALLGIPDPPRTPEADGETRKAGK